MTLRQLEVFLAVVKYGDVSRAANHLRITPWTVKVSVANLYKAIGARNRTHAAVILWPVLGDAYEIEHTPTAA